MTDQPPSDAGASAPVRKTTEAERRRAFRVLFACLVVTGAGNSMLFALLPPLARKVGMGELAVGLVYMVSGVLFTVMSQVWGSLSDRYGRRPFILSGLTGFSVSTTVMAIVVALGLGGLIGAGATAAGVIIARGLFGAFGSATGTVAQAYVADRTAPHERTRAIAGLTAGFGLGGALGPALAGLAAPHVGLVVPFAATAALALLGAAIAWFAMPERTPPKPQAGRGALLRAMSLAGDPRLRAILFFGCALWMGQGATLQTTGFLIMDRLDVGGEAAAGLSGGVLSIGALALLAGQVVIIPLLRLVPRAAIALGGLAGVAGAALMTVAGDLGLVTVAFALMSLGMGLARPGMASAASLAVEPHEQGAAAGLAMATAGMGFLLAPVTGVLAYRLLGPWAPFAITAAGLAGALALALRSRGLARASARARPAALAAATDPPPPSAA